MPKKEIIQVQMAASNPNLSAATRFGNLVFVAGRRAGIPSPARSGANPRADAERARAHQARARGGGHVARQRAHGDHAPDQARGPRRLQRGVRALLPHAEAGPDHRVGDAQLARAAVEITVTACIRVDARVGARARVEPASRGGPEAHRPSQLEEDVMKDGLRFVDSDMHIMEPPDLFDRYLDPKFRHRVIVPVGADGRRPRAAALIVIDGLPTSDMDLQQYRKRVRPRLDPEHPAPLRLAALRHRAAGLRDRARLRRRGAGDGHGDGGRGHRRPLSRPPASALLARNNMDPRLSLGHLPGLQQLDPRVLPAQPRPAQVRGDAARARRAPRLPRAGAVRARAGRGRVVHPAEPRQRPLLALELLGPALQPPRGAERDLGLPRGRERARTPA